MKPRHLRIFYAGINKKNRRRVNEIKKWSSIRFTLLCLTAVYAYGNLIYAADIWTVTSHTGMLTGSGTAIVLWTKKINSFSAHRFTGNMFHDILIPFITLDKSECESGAFLHEAPDHSVCSRGQLTCFLGDVLSLNLDLSNCSNLKSELPPQVGTVGSRHDGRIPSFYPDAPIYQTRTYFNCSRVQSSCSLTNWSLFFLISLTD